MLMYRYREKRRPADARWRWPRRDSQTFTHKHKTSRCGRGGRNISRPRSRRRCAHALGQLPELAKLDKACIVCWVRGSSLCIELLFQLGHLGLEQGNALLQHSLRVGRLLAELLEVAAY